MQASADLMGIGEHCSHPACGQIDFLPFKCKCCGRVFCLSHSRPADHSCESQVHDTNHVIVCPICVKGIKVGPSEEVHEAFDAHTRVSCDPANYQRVKKPGRCPAPGCKERLREVNSFVCKDCGVKVCLGHRFPSDHACKGKPTRAAQPQRFNDTIGKHAMAMSKQASEHAVAMSKQASDFFQRQATQPAPAVARPRPNAATTGTAGTEACPQCGQTFSDVAALIQHVDRQHAQGNAAASSTQCPPQQQQRQAQLQRCPECQQAFADPIELVRHVQQHRYSSSQAQRQTSQKSECVIC